MNHQINLLDLIPKRLCAQCKYTQNTDMLKKLPGYLYCEAINKWVKPDDKCASFEYQKKEEDPETEVPKKRSPVPEGLPF